MPFISALLTIMGYYTMLAIIPKGFLFSGGIEKQHQAAMYSSVNYTFFPLTNSLIYILDQT